MPAGTSIGAGCTLTLSHELAPEWADYKDRTQQGWNTMVSALQRVLGQALRTLSSPRKD